MESDGNSKRKIFLLFLLLYFPVHCNMLRSGAKICCNNFDENNLSNLGYSDCWKTFTFSEVTFGLINGLELRGCEMIFDQIFSLFGPLF